MDLELKYYNQKGVWDAYSKNTNEIARAREVVSCIPDDVKTVLDIGCGNGKYLVFLKSLGFKTDGIDSSPTAVEMTKEALNDDSNVLLTDMYEYDFPKEQYDLVISIAAIHHGLKAQVRRTIKQIYTALLSGGIFFCYFA